jgi:hypothetical protein
MEEFGVDAGQESANCVDQVEARQLLELFLSFQVKALSQPSLSASPTANDTDGDSAKSSKSRGGIERDN